jgi:hypothetical protein
MPIGGPDRAAMPFYQRLLVNPFLAVIALLLTLAATDAFGRSSRPDLARPVLLAGGVASLLALQYHCLDCGATDWFRRWRRHACPRVVERWQTPFSAAARLFPAPTTQLVLWLFILVAAWLFLASMFTR